MLRTDIAQFTRRETTELDDSFTSEGPSSRVFQAILGGVITGGVGLGLFLWGVSRDILLATLLVYVVLFTVEKLSYIRLQGSSRAAMRKLVRRIDELEGLTATPDNAKPSRLVS